MMENSDLDQAKVPGVYHQEKFKSRMLTERTQRKWFFISFKG
jgi:hypothetical protein